MPPGAAAIPIPANFRIRRARASDAPELSRLCAQLGREVSEQEVRERLRRLGPRQHALFVAEAFGAQAPPSVSRKSKSKSISLAGWLMLQAKLSLHSGRFAEVTGLIVDEPARRQGVGAALMECAEQWAAERKFPAVWLRSNVKRVEAHEFYRRLGYQVLKTSLTFTKSVAPAPGRSRSSAAPTNTAAAQRKAKAFPHA